MSWHTYPAFSRRLWDMFSSKPILSQSISDDVSIYCIVGFFTTTRDWFRNYVHLFTIFAQRSISLFKHSANHTRFNALCFCGKGDRGQVISVQTTTVQVNIFLQFIDLFRGSSLVLKRIPIMWLVCDEHPSIVCPIRFTNDRMFMLIQKEILLICKNEESPHFPLRNISQQDSFVIFLGSRMDVKISHPFNEGGRVCFLCAFCLFLDSSSDRRGM